MYIPKERRESKLHAVAYEGIYTGYHSSTQYRVYDPRKNRFEWPTTVKFFEDRKGVQLLSRQTFPKYYNTLRADVATNQPDNSGVIQDPMEKDIESMSSDDGDQGDPRGPTTVTPPLPRIEEIEDIRYTSAEGEPSDKSPNLANDTGDLRLRGPGTSEAIPISPQTFREDGEALGQSNAEEITDQETTSEAGAQVYFLLRIILRVPTRTWKTALLVRRH